MAQHRPGHFTASTIAPFLTGKGDQLLAGGIEAAKRLADERLSLDGYVYLEEPWQGNDATAWGDMFEPDAIKRYEEVEFVTVHGQQRVIQDGWKSCTPDGLVGADGMVQTKCPMSTKIHRTYLLDPRELVKSYHDQVQFEMMLAGRKWNDLVSFHPNWKSPLDIVVVRVQANPDWQERCRDRIQQAEAVISETIKAVLSKAGSDVAELAESL